MKKHYFLQNLTTSTIYHLDLCQYNPNIDYLNILARTLLITDIDLTCRLSYKSMPLNQLAYRILVYSFARLSGFNQRSSVFKSSRECLAYFISDMSLIYRAIENFKPFYKIFKSDNFYGFTCF